MDIEAWILTNQSKKLDTEPDLEAEEKKFVSPAKTADTSRTEEAKDTSSKKSSGTFKYFF